MKHGCAIWGIYLGGCLAAAAAVQYELDGVVLAYTAPSSLARNAVERFLGSGQHHRFKKVLEDRPGESVGENVKVKFVPENRGRSYKIRQIVEGTDVIYQAVDTTEEFWYILREFGPGTKFTCDDILHSSVLEIDPSALRGFAREYVVILPLNGQENLRIVLFFGVLMDHFHHDPALLMNALREIQAIAKMKNDTPQWPQEERQAVVRDAAAWLGLGEDDLRALDLRQLFQRNEGAPIATPQGNPRGSAKVKALHLRAR
ncbi:MAG: hypothetical protein LBD40_00720 [Puniceicoccales bacterium]|jgi:hypothetical protein|nr:hypothetical protein [Puniceicoccales bacterium]